MMSRLALALLALATVACGKKEAPTAAPRYAMDTPRATAEAIVLAFKERSADIALALLPPDELIRKHFDCPEDGMVKAVAARRANAPKNFAAAPKDLVVELGAFDKSGSSDQQLRVGDEFEGCKAKALATVHKSKVDLRITQGGNTRFDEETWTFLKLGDAPKWYSFR
jgi:hypothetical protein